MNIRKLRWIFDFRRVDGMSVLFKKRTGLPMNIYFDEFDRKTRHGKRIKFQSNKKDSAGISCNYYTMTISDTPEVIVRSRMRNELSSKDVDLLRRWVISNKDLLLRLTSSDDPFDVIDFIEQSNNASSLV